MVHVAVHLLAVAAVASFASATEYIFDPDAFVPGADPSTTTLQAPSQRNSRRGFMTSFDESNMCGTVDTSQARELCRQIVRHCERQVADFCEQDSACEGNDDRTTLGFRCFVEAVDDPGFYEIMGRTAEGGEWYRPSACGLSFLFKDFLRPKDLPFFMCLADKKSEYYPRQFNKHHGIFGLGSQWGWCRAENPEEQKDVRYISCEIDCKDTHDLHLKDDLVCVFKILHFKGIDGFGKEVFPRCCSSYAAKAYSAVELCGSKYATDDYLIEDKGRGDDSKFADLPNVCLVGPVAGFDYPKLWTMKAFERFPERVEAERELLKQGKKVLAPAGFDSTPMKEYPGLMGGSSRRRRDSPSSGEGKAEVKSAVSEYVFNPDNFIPGADPSTTSLNRLPLYGYMNAFKENYMCGNVGDDQARELCRQIVRHCQKQVADFCGQDEGAACTGKGDKIQLSWRCFLDAVEDPGFYEVMGRSAGLSLFRDVHPCALYNLMKEYVRPEDIPFFLCLINTKSTFDHRKSDHGEFHGLFGLGSDYGWCRKDDSWQRDNQIDIKCNLPCKDTYDLHLKDDLRCVFNVLEYLGIEEGFGPEVYHKCCSLHDYKSFNPVDICQSKYATNDYPEEEGRAADKLPVPNMCLIDEGRDFDYERIWQEPALANVASRFWTERTLLRRGHNVYTPTAFGTTPMKNYVNIMKNVATARAGKALPEFETSEEDKDLSLFEDAGRRRRRSLSSEDEESFAEAEAESGAFSRHRRSFAEAEAEAEAESGAFTRRRRSFAEAEAEAEAESGAFSRRRRSLESFAEAEAEAEAESFPQRRRRSSGWAQSESRSRSRRSTSDDEGNYDDYDQEDDEDENESAVWSNPRSGKSSSEIVEDDDDYEYTEERHTPGYEDYDTNNVKRIGKSKVSSVNPDEYVFNDEYNESLEDDDAYYPDSYEKYGKRKGKNDGETEDDSDTSPNIDLSDIILTIPVSVPSTPDNVEVGSRRRRAAKPGIFTPKERCAIILDPVDKAKYPGQVCDDERVRAFLMEETLDSLSTVL